MTEKCEMCLENDSEMDFNYALPLPHKFTPEVSDNPNLFSAKICLDCFGSVISDVEIVVVIGSKRRRNLLHMQSALESLKLLKRIGGIQEEGRINNA